MINLIKDKRILWLGFLLSLILLLLGNALSWINDDFYKWLESKVDYKWMLTILLMLTLSIIFVWLYSFTFHKPNQKPTQKELKEVRNKKIGIIKSLGVDEKEVLREYLKKDKKTLEAGFTNSVVLSLEHRGILVRLAVIGDLYMRAPYTVEDTYWELIKNDRSLLQ